MKTGDKPEIAKKLVCIIGSLIAIQSDYEDYKI